MLTWERLKELLFYCAVTGIFTWRVDRTAGVKVGDVAGSHNKASGYMRIKVDGKTYFAHRLAWFYVYGEWPTNKVDHINAKDIHDGLNKIDNRIVNLRDVDNRGNQSNRRKHRKGGLVGTSFCKRSGKWLSSIGQEGKKKFLGYFPTEHEASDVYQAVLAELKEGLNV